MFLTIVGKAEVDTTVMWLYSASDIPPMNTCLDAILSNTFWALVQEFDGMLESVTKSDKGAPWDGEEVGGVAMDL